MEASAPLHQLVIQDPLWKYDKLPALLGLDMTILFILVHGYKLLGKMEPKLEVIN